MRILISQKALVGESVSLSESLARSVGASSGTLDGAPVGVKPGRRTSDGYTNVQDHDKRLAPPPSVPRSPSGSHPLGSCLPFEKDPKLKVPLNF